MNECIICGIELPKNQPLRCIPCYCNSNNDKKVAEWMAKDIQKEIK